jgi:hypothetical protein
MEFTILERKLLETEMVLIRLECINLVWSEGKTVVGEQTRY